MEHRIYSKVLHLTLCIALVLSFIPMMGAAVNAEDNHITEIASEADWNEFGNAVNGGYNYKDQTVVLLNDITVTEMMIGTANSQFEGVFEGNGHTINFNYVIPESYADGDYCAPFRYVRNATIQNLKVSGTIVTAKKHAAGFVGNSRGNTRIVSCYSNIAINSSVKGDGTHAGFVGLLENGTLSFHDCLFDGSISGKNTDQCGGFIGWPTVHYAIFTNCLNDGEFNTSYNGCGTFTRIHDETADNITIDRDTCFYKTAYGLEQGSPIGDMTPDELREALGNESWIVSGGKVVPFPFKASATVTKAPVPAAKKMTANGKVQKLIKNGKASGGNMMYALGTDSKSAPEDGWSRLIPTGKKAGTYYVWYKVKANEFHLDTEPACVTVRITKPVRKVDCATKALIRNKDKKALIKKMEELDKMEEQQAENPGGTDGKPAGIGTMLREQIRNVRDTLSNIVKGIFRK